jgi:hypothetical protein
MDSRLLTSGEHTELHKLVDEAGKARGIPTKREGTQQANDWFRNQSDPFEAEAKVQDALMEAYKRFDMKHGTSFTSEFRQQLRGLGAMP